MTRLRLLEKLLFKPLVFTKQLSLEMATGIRESKMFYHLKFVDSLSMLSNYVSRIVQTMFLDWCTSCKTLDTAVKMMENIIIASVEKQAKVKIHIIDTWLTKSDIVEMIQDLWTHIKSDSSDPILSTSELKDIIRRALDASLLSILSWLRKSNTASEEKGTLSLVDTWLLIDIMHNHVSPEIHRSLTELRWRRMGHEVHLDIKSLMLSTRALVLETCLPQVDKQNEISVDPEVEGGSRALMSSNYQNVQLSEEITIKKHMA